MNNDLNKAFNDNEILADHSRSYQQFIISRKSKFVPVHAMQACGMSGGVAPLILDLGLYMGINAQIRA